ncbi:hypothetical protein [Streptomyces sp. NPDC001985]|uniref:hypothetical protein n=1 Tax=Streptomyces sp. NPDC001985 TaxID=3154406 RepID=UPI00331FD0FE
MTVTGYRRFTAAGVTAAVLLLAGCGSGDGQGGTDAKSTPSASAAPGGPDGTGSVRATRLDDTAVRALLPTDDSVPGWKAAAPASAFDLTAANAPTGPTCGKKTTDPICENAVAAGSAMFLKEGAGTVTFMLYAYEDAASASAAYPAMLGRGGDGMTGLSSPAKLPAAVGEQHDVIRGTSSVRTPGATVQIRVGTTLLAVQTGGLQAERRGDGELRELAGMFAERSRQAQNGEPPSARVGG